ncbi:MULTISPECIES: TauD/TfdA family dioxygenase [unclassified Crossiella]|uniref:TauD/TfdA dioxygenase family protein n=1 Tax=unclassified Crossiella TaxID=2620835 RepID=UPI002000144F|nr:MULTISPECIES: TauD/TfdA family dioxygenase [unclassified Crossiella]MCK2245420.1 TauD/TfdA family dioxygenase [Crossiella sp. S99.2]MCK2259072.1 TauD/TfdA family dioxygenase [Crossiella sp. S99.1]
MAHAEPRCEIRPVNPTIGGEVSGLDLRHALTPATVKRLRAGLLDRKVLFFRRQELSTDEFERFGRLFGDMFDHPTMPKLPDNPYINPVETAHGPAKDWHIGGPWRPNPFIAELLQLKITPPAGGDTMWADLQAAYRSLSAPMQHLVDELSAAYLADPAQYSPDTRAQATSCRETIHPLVITHPETGERGLYFSTSAVRIVGLGDLEQETLIRFVKAHATQARFIVRWRWQPGDLAVWDNRAVWHAAVDDYGDAPRLGWHASVDAQWTPR